MTWKAYYSDGSTYTGAVEDAPARDVQVIVQSSREHGWQAVSGDDYYIWRETRWIGVDLFGLYDYLIEPGWKRVLFGRTISNNEFDAIWQQAMSDPDMPEKTAFGRGERKPQ